MQLGFVIDHSRCIGCHACTVACKSENDVPLGSFRTWVKYTEQGAFPEVRRSFAVLRCNQCSDAPCVQICPVRALEKRSDGIVDVDPQRCIGCKGCLHGCPYDALYVNDATGTAEKCHFCAHRTEIGLAPACAVVCPTEAIIPGDFHDPQSRVSRLRATEELSARKVEAGTNPNVLYREAAPAGLEPLNASAAGGYLWANQVAGIQLDAQLFEDSEAKAQARTVYDVHHLPSWGGRVSGYLFAKSVAAGSFLAGAPLLPPLSPSDGPGSTAGPWIAGLALLGLLVTGALLIADLKRPERFWYILRHANRDSWLARGTLILLFYGALISGWIGLHLLDLPTEGRIAGVLVGVTSLGAALTAVYTAWLFGQAKGRVLWMRRGMAVSLFVHAVLAGAAVLLLLGPLLDAGPQAVSALRWTLAASLAVQLVLTRIDSRLAPPGRQEEYRRALRLLTHGPFADRHRLAVALTAGGLLALVAAAAGLTGGGIAAALLALAGLFLEQDNLVRAGQALPIS